jgi:hypothetical protein
VTHIELLEMRMEYTTRGPKPSWRVLRVWASKLGKRFRGGMEQSWRHLGVRVEAKLPHEGRGGRRM